MLFCFHYRQSRWQFNINLYTSPPCDTTDTNTDTYTTDIDTATDTADTDASEAISGSVVTIRRYYYMSLTVAAYGIYLGIFTMPKSSACYIMKTTDIIITWSRVGSKTFYWLVVI
mmetsp:Transcript_22218/g.25003  ORF Transcript_22218/g.25003 Transcript_22218/m.25003 type:complete len:115 (+) Transcript_22218:144-488(+)